MSRSDFERLVTETFNKLSATCGPHLERLYRSTPADAVALVRKVAADLSGKPVPNQPPQKKRPGKTDGDFWL